MILGRGGGGLRRRNQRNQRWWHGLVGCGLWLRRGNVGRQRPIGCVAVADCPLDGRGIAQLLGHRHHDRHPPFVVAAPRRRSPAAHKRAHDREHGMQPHREGHALLERARLQPPGPHDHDEPGGRRYRHARPDDRRGAHRRHVTSCDSRTAPARRSPPARHPRPGKPRRPRPCGRAAPPARRESSR